MSGAFNEAPYEDFGLLIEEDVKEPPAYAVLIHNDDYTTMEFVVAILVEIFHKSTTEASEIMNKVHEKGIGQCGIYTREIADTKVAQVHARARRAGFPLKCTTEEVQ